MAERLRLFVSTGLDLEAEREIIGQAVARLPVSLGWAIKRTPNRGEPLAPALVAIRACDFYVLLLSKDISAPVGLELITARRAQKILLAFLVSTQLCSQRTLVRCSNGDDCTENCEIRTWPRSQRAARAAGLGSSGSR